MGHINQIRLKMLWGKDMICGFVLRDLVAVHAYVVKMTTAIIEERLKMMKMKP